MELVNSTVGSTGGTSAIYGGAYDHRPVKVRLLDCTVNGNETYGVFLRGFSVGVYVAAAEHFGTIVSGHAQSFAVTQESNGFATFTSLGYNISSDATGNLTGPGDHPSTDPLLGVLAYNGGQTPTFNLKPGSPALDQIPLQSQLVGVDQRGFGRSLTTADIGAVERVIGGDVNGDRAVTVNDIFYLINYLFAGGPVPVGESDVNGDGVVDVSDVFYLINNLFAGGPAPI